MSPHRLEPGAVLGKVPGGRGGAKEGKGPQDARHRWGKLLTDSYT